MKLVRIGSQAWDVLAIIDHRNRCPVLEFLGEVRPYYPAAAEGMFALLRSVLPAAGPPRSEPLVKSMGDGIYELRKQPKGKKLRVLWFYGGGSVIVCTAAFSKAERTPQI